MPKKETVTRDDLMRVIRMMDGSGIKYWLDGGWGVDVLAGRQSREHRDVDIDFDSRYTRELLAMLTELGYGVETDWSPVRIELYSGELGYIDIHPFVIGGDGSAKQADLCGGWYEFEPDCFGSAVFEDVEIPCISAKGQRLFHTGYELREKDRHDLAILDALPV